MELSQDVQELSGNNKAILAFIADERLHKNSAIFLAGLSYKVMALHYLLHAPVILLPIIGVKHRLSFYTSLQMNGTSP